MWLALPWLFLCAAIGLLLHHGWKHHSDAPENDRARSESCVGVCYFQPSDVSNHETWILVCVAVAVTLWGCCLVSIQENSW